MPCTPSHWQATLLPSLLARVGTLLTPLLPRSLFGNVHASGRRCNVVSVANETLHMPHAGFMLCFADVMLLQVGIFTQAEC